MSTFSYSLLPAVSSSFFQTIGNVAWRIDVARKGLSAGRKGRRTSFRERYAGGTIIGYPRLTNCTVNRPRFNEALSSSLLACRMENEKRNYPLVPDELSEFWIDGAEGGREREKVRDCSSFWSIPALQLIVGNRHCRRFVVIDSLAIDFSNNERIISIVKWNLERQERESINDFWRFFRYNFLEITVLPIKGNRCSLKKIILKSRAEIRKVSKFISSFS